jgi:hypothetical protein
VTCQFCESEAVTRRLDADMCLECADLIDALNYALANAEAESE